MTGSTTVNTTGNVIRNIWAVGRNYADHAKELNNAIPTEPLIFLKAGSTAVLNQNSFEIPSWALDVHHEIELALKFDKNLEISEIALALDLTERSLQTKLKNQGLPWTLAKSFTNSCPLSRFIPIKSLSELKNLNLTLQVNNELRQKGNTEQFIFSLEILIDYVKSHFPVVEGDLLLTGTPAGVAKIEKGDVLEAKLSSAAHPDSDLLQWQWKVC